MWPIGAEYDEYVAKLIKCGIEKERAETMADRMNDLHYEEEKDLLNARE